ncbi:polyphosphate kinase 1 [bacterium]|nr:polyphosphate kinase 1 [bacterium]
MPEDQFKTIINRDISWLSFNERVLQEARNPDVPLIERMRFLGIYSNNLDEFFRVRVATLRRVVDLLHSNTNETSQLTQAVLKEIQDKVLDLQKIFYTTYQEILKELEKQHIYILNEHELDPNQEEWVKKYYIDEVEAYINPIIISNVKKFPYLRDKSVYLFCRITKSSGKNVFALIELPTEDISRFCVLPGSNGTSYVIYLDDVIRYNMPHIFSIFEPIEIESYIIKMTRDAELDLDDDISESYYEKIMKSVSQRKKGKPVRFVYDREMPQEQLDFILKNVKIAKDNRLIPGGRYHNFRDFMGFPDLSDTQLTFQRKEPIRHHDLDPQKSILKQIEKKDILIQVPYHSFDYVIDMVREAAIDPKVLGIKVSLYRVASNSKIIKALKNAARNGKQVEVIIELRARFDEEANLEWSRQLQEENITVDFGLKGLKVHSKLLLIQKKIKGGIKNIAFISTGNFHEGTAKIYCDTALLTAYEPITEEVERVFSMFNKPYLSHKFNHLMVAPINLRRSIYDLIDHEIEDAKNGRPAKIIIKVNNLVDEEMIAKFYEASLAGVKINLLVRGVCSLVPQIPGKSENIEVRSIVGRYLEHSRVFWFHASGKNKLFIGSADLMTRNLDARIEVLSPIYNEEIREELMAYLELQWADNTKARIIDSEMSNSFYQNNEAEINAQMAMYDLLQADQIKTDHLPEILNLSEDTLK